MGISITEKVSGLTPTGQSLQTYSNAYVIVENFLLTQETSVSIEKKSNSSPRTTLAKGFAGMAKGAGTCEVTVENAVPSKDLELRPDFFLISGMALEIGVVIASRTMRCKGFITEVQYQHAVNDSARMSFKMLCRLEEFE